MLGCSSHESTCDSAWVEGLGLEQDRTCPGWTTLHSDSLIGGISRQDTQVCWRVWENITRKLRIDPFLSTHSGTEVGIPLAVVIVVGSF